MKIELKEHWQLAGRKEAFHAEPRIFTDAEFVVPASVPGNIEDALFHGGILPDPYFAENSSLYRKYEFYEWLYTTEFEWKDEPESCEFVFEGVDCFASYFLNGEKIAETDDALIPHHIPARNLKKGRNTLCIHIASANNRTRDTATGSFSSNVHNYETLSVRKPAHVWGWDIAPRLALGGIFRPVRLETLPSTRILERALFTGGVTKNSARLYLQYHLTSDIFALEGLKLRVEGVCGDSTFRVENPIWSYNDIINFQVQDPKLWWPRNYGEPNLYDLTLSILAADGSVLYSETFKYGIRTVKLFRREMVTTSPDPDFQFIINGKKVRLFGTNHVPVDALHSRDRERLPELMEMIRDINCNIIRLWGGNIFEDDYFYDFCDRNGIFIWHDFMMACAIYPNDEIFQKKLRAESETAVRRLRNHPSILLWAGDNECDMVPFWNLRSDPLSNKLTRDVLPTLCRMLDPARPFLPSSPCLSAESIRAWEESGEQGEPQIFAPEQHLWGPRDYFRSNYYRCTRASFVSELGYHGCPSASSIRKFISPEKLWPAQNNTEWLHHASNPYLPDTNLSYRIPLMFEQAGEYFEKVPETLEEFTLASQFCQAEALKFFIELVKSRPKMSGIIWWNLLDCWPQFSDAVVDYYFNRKLAYYYIKRLQQPVTVIVCEAADWERRVLVSNDSMEDRSGSYRIRNAETGKTLFSGKFRIAAGSVEELERQRCCTTEKALLLTEWTLDDGTKGVNHFICGSPKFDFKHCTQVWLPAIAALDHSFQADKIGK